MRFNGSQRIACAIASGLAGVCLGGPAVHSSFDTDAEGWTTDKDARDFRWESGDGNPAGSIAANDIGTGQYWRFDAPAVYLGDRSSSYGETLSYDMRQLGIVGGVVTQPDIRLSNGAQTIEYRFGVAPTAVWSSFGVVIAEGQGWTVGGAPASEAQIRAVLENLTALSIRGEYRVGADSAAMDNVRLGAGCPADFDNNTVLNFFDIAAFVDAFNNADPSADFAAPTGVFNFFDLSAYVDAFTAGC